MNEGIKNLISLYLLIFIVSVVGIMGYITKDRCSGLIAIIIAAPIIFLLTYLISKKD